MGLNEKLNMFLFKKLDKEKIEFYKRKQAEETRKEVEKHYLNVIRSMRIQYEKDIQSLTEELKLEFLQEKQKIINAYNDVAKQKKKEYENNIDKLKTQLKDYESFIKDSQKAWSLINDHLPRMQHLSTKTRMFKEKKVSPYIDDYKEAQMIEDEWEAYIRAMDKKQDKINKLLRMEEVN